MRFNNRDDLHSENFNIFGGPYITQSNICHGAFIAKIVSHLVYSQKAPS